MLSMKKLINSLNDGFFQAVHGHRLIYNTCWEDPAIDRKLLAIDPQSRIVMITSAGCNTLDYMLDDPAQIHAVDVNPRQNALLELKTALILRGDHQDFFKMFGSGSHDNYTSIYHSIRGSLSQEAKNFWDRKIRYFKPGRGLRRSFYYHGTSGWVAWFFSIYVFYIKREAGPHVRKLLAAESLAQQRSIYEQLDGCIWDGFNRWIIRQPALMSLVGVPRSQVRLIDETYPGGLEHFVRDKLRHVFTTVPIRDNYFWRVYLNGAYTADCCPNYLKSENFAHLQRTVRNIRTYTLTLTDFLRQYPGRYSHYILLDHQDWMAGNAPEALEEEWELILQNSLPGTKILFRSAGLDHGFLPRAAKQALRFFACRTDNLHVTDRVGTYGSLHFAEVA